MSGLYTVRGRRLEVVSVAESSAESPPKAIPKDAESD